MKTFKKSATILLTLLIVVLCIAVFAACDPKDDHEHKWQEVENTATCTAAGEIVSKCEVCGEEKREPSEALGHDWDEENIEIVTASDCQKEGAGKVSCKRCPEKKDVVIPKLPHNIKRPVLSKIKPATCTTPGSKEGECDMCKQYVTVEIPALGHDFSGTSVIVSEPSCEGKGIREITCKRKGCDGGENGKPAVQVIESPALGHDWQTRAVVDKDPTFDEAGKRSVHCNRCEKTKDDEVLPKLVAGQKTTYKWRIARFNGEPLNIGLSSVKIAVKDENGNPVKGDDGNPVVSNSSNFNQNDATMTVALPPANYTVEVTGLPAGYTAESSYAIAPGNVYKDLLIHSSLLPASQATDKTSYNLGSVMHDYTFKDVRGNKTVKLSDLLAQKKMVLLNFFFVSCGACQSEMPGLVSAYNIYKDDMAVVMLDCVPYDTNEKIISDFLRPFGVPQEWVVAQDITPNNPDPTINYNNICEKFHSTSAPQNMIIDREGVVVYWEIGSTSEMAFRDTFKKYTSAQYAGSEPAKDASEQQTMALRIDLDIPRKDKEDL